MMRDSGDVVVWGSCRGVNGFFFLNLRSLSDFCILYPLVMTITPDAPAGDLVLVCKVKLDFSINGEYVGRFQ